MPRFLRFSLPLLILCLLTGCSSLQRGGYTADGYEWEADRDTYSQGDPYCFVTAQRSEEEGVWYCFVDILEREILDITLVVSEESIGEPVGYGYYIDEADASPFTVEEELSSPDWYLTFSPRERLSLDDPSSYFIGIEGSYNNTNLVVIPGRVAQAVDQFLVEQYGSLDEAEKTILEFWYQEYGEELWDSFWDGSLWDNSYSFDDIFGEDGFLFGDEVPSFATPDGGEPQETGAFPSEAAFPTSFHSCHRGKNCRCPYLF